MQRLTGELNVKPENMLRNLDQGCGLATSETVMMALAKSLGRDRAHKLVGELAHQARNSGIPFRDVVAAHPEVARTLSQEQIHRCLDYRHSLGLATELVDHVLAAHRKMKRARRVQT